MKALELENARLRAHIATQYAMEAVRSSVAEPAGSQMLLSSSQLQQQPQRHPSEVLLQALLITCLQIPTCRYLFKQPAL
jgi:hypothetical protein